MQTPSPVEIGNFMFGVVGALVGGGVVWGRMSQKIEHLERSQDEATEAFHASELVSDRKREELSREIRNTRSELKSDLLALRTEVRDDIRELQRLIVERMK